MLLGKNSKAGHFLIEQGRGPGLFGVEK